MAQNIAYKKHMKQVASQMNETVQHLFLEVHYGLS